jgi:pimeloyl-ACP methyl ester carboxylesterase
MPKKESKKSADFIVPLYMNGLRGRMLRMPAPKRKKREILLVYGHHASLERVFGLADLLNDYGAVTMPDLPGFGGIDSFYRIGQKPSLDNLADYLAAFVKLRYRNRRFTIVALSFGFAVVTRMLQKHPDIAKKVDLLISIVGFMHYDEFTFSRRRYLFYRYGATLFSRPLTATFFKNVILHPVIIRRFYSRTHNAKHKFAHILPEQRQQMTEFEVYLWRCNDMRTHMDTSITMLTLNNCNQRVDLPVWHLVVESDNYFDNRVVEQHMRVVFSDYTAIPIKLKSHSVSVVADKKSFSPFVPPKLRKLLSQDP